MQQEASDDATPAKALITPKSTKKAKRSAAKEEDVNDLPHGLGAIPDIPVKEEEDSTSPTKRASRAKKTIKASKVKKEDVDELVAKATTTTDASLKKKAKAKDNAYGLTPGKTPYPNWPCSRTH